MTSEDIINIITKAASCVAEPYLNLITTYEPSGIVRERVFCYELYHQIRKIIGDNGKVTLNGEIDKRGHVDFAIEHRLNPDFVFHIPGTHGGNTVVVEVKGKLVNEIIKDLETLIIFVNHYHYEAGILLIYNHTFEELKIKYGSTIKEKYNGFNIENIYVITLPKAKTLQGIYTLNNI